MLGQSISGDFAFNSAPGPNGTRVVTISLLNGHLNLADGLVQLDISGFLRITGDGIAGALSVSGDPIVLGPVSFHATANVLINTTTTPARHRLRHRHAAAAGRQVHPR